MATVSSVAAASVGVPNPATDAFAVAVPAVAVPAVAVPAVAGASQVPATLLNSLGQEVAWQSASLPAAGVQLTFSRGELASGVYLLRVQAGDTNLIKRLIIK